METTQTRILVPLDGSPAARRALPVASRLAAQLGAEVILLRVVPPRLPERNYPADLLGPTDLAEQSAAAELKVEAASLSGLPVRRVVLVGTSAAAEIVAWLRREPVDFVVMATRALGRIRSLIVGSVTEAVLQSGLAPVVAVPVVAAGAESDRFARVPVKAA